MFKNKVERAISDFVVYTKYSNHIESENRRQNWTELVDELKQMYIRKFPNLESEINENFEFVYNRQVLPSMRSLHYGGFPIEINPARIYNCGYGHCSHRFYFAEAMFLLLSGCGLGSSVRSRHTNKLDKVVGPEGERRFLIGDSIEGWADSIRQLMYAYLKGNPRPRFDYRDIRPKGSKIKKAGGIAPGHEKLMVSHEKIEQILKQAIGRKLTPLECFDILGWVAKAVISGGIRESAMIILFDVWDSDMATSKGTYKCKNTEIIETTDEGWKIRTELLQDQIMNTNCYNGTNIQEVFITNKYGDYDLQQALEGNLAYYYLHPQRGMANISAAINRNTVTESQFKNLWYVTKETKSGDPGVYLCNSDDEGTNPCAEINFNTGEYFCNLTSTIVYDVTTQAELNRRVKASAFIGTLQATFTDFHYLRPVWKERTEAEALLGVSMTGIASGNLLDLDESEAAMVALMENERVANIVGINKAARVTTLKPEGSGTWAAGVQGNGIHWIHDHYYIRNNRIKKKEPIYKYITENFPQELYCDEFLNEDTTAVVSFPMKAPENALLRPNKTAIEALELVARLHKNWIQKGHRSGSSTNNVSCTISVRDNEWDEVINWMWDNRNSYNAIALFPYSDHIYKQAPFQTITQAEYEYLYSIFPDNLNFESIEETTNTINHSSDNKACIGGVCEI